MAQILLNEPQVDAGFEQMRGPRVAQRVYRSALVAAALFQRRAEGVLHAASSHRFG